MSSGVGAGQCNLYISKVRKTYVSTHVLFTSRRAAYRACRPSQVEVLLIITRIRRSPRGGQRDSFVALPRPDRYCIVRYYHSVRRYAQWLLRRPRRQDAIDSARAGLTSVYQDAFTILERGFGKSSPSRVIITYLILAHMQSVEARIYREILVMLAPRQGSAHSRIT